MPSAEISPARRPWPRLRAATYVMSGPGARFSASVATKNERQRHAVLSAHACFTSALSRGLHRRRLAIAVTGAQRPSQPPVRLEEATIADLQQRMQSGQETSRSLVDKYLARIEAVDRSGPALHSVIEINPDAPTIADQLDAERKARRVARAAARHPDSAQGQHRHRRSHDDDGRVAGAGGRRSRPRTRSSSRGCARRAR